MVPQGDTYVFFKLITHNSHVSSRNRKGLLLTFSEQERCSLCTLWQQLSAAQEEVIQQEQGTENYLKYLSGCFGQERFTQALTVGGMLSLCLSASAHKILTSYTCKTLKRAANSYGVCGPDVPKTNNHYNAVSVIRLITTVWGAGRSGLGSNQEPTHPLYQAIPTLKSPSRSSLFLISSVLTTKLKLGKATTC